MKRYNFIPDEWNAASIEEHAEGKYVLASDVEVLQRERDNLAKAVAGTANYGPVYSRRMTRPRGEGWTDCSAHAFDLSNKSTIYETRILYSAPCPTTLLHEFDQAYRAFQGAFDTPQMRRSINNEYASDARARLRAFSERLAAVAAGGTIAVSPAEK